jgi:hypothetical protein
MLAGCGGAQSGMPAGGWAASQLPSLASSTSGDLLYFGHAVGRRPNFRGLLSVVMFPSGKPFATIDLPGLAQGACSDTSGNVWVVVKENYDFNAYEYAHGGTVPIATIHIVRAQDFATDCAVDPSTGNLAVLVGGRSATSYAEIWAHAREGKPARYQMLFTPTSCVYDADGNLFVDGWSGDTVLFELAELSKGSRAFANVTLDKPPLNYPGHIRWDGSDIDIADNSFSDSFKIYRVKVSGYSGHVAQIVRLKYLSYLAVFDVHGARLAGTAGSNGRFLSLWPFPAGGKSTRTLAKLKYQARGVAISVGSH